jgi:catechol 2,3-dioxygenase-like lactoylglutathione lyase family enzyme
MTPRFAGGPNLAMKVPPHQWDATVAFYRDVLGLPELPPVDSEPPSAGFAFGACRLWIDRVAATSQAEVWLEITTDDPAAAAAHLAAAPGVARVDEIEPLAPGSPRFWISSPAQVVHLVGPVAAQP